MTIKKFGDYHIVIIITYYKQYYYDSEIKLHQPRELEFICGLLVISLLFMIGNVCSRWAYPCDGIVYVLRDENHIVEVPIYVYKVYSRPNNRLTDLYMIKKIKTFELSNMFKITLVC